VELTVQCNKSLVCHLAMPRLTTHIFSLLVVEAQSKTDEVDSTLNDQVVSLQEDLAAIKVEMANKESEYENTLTTVTNQYETSIEEINKQLGEAKVVKDDFETLNEEYLFQKSTIDNLNASVLSFKSEAEEARNQLSKANESISQLKDSLSTLQVMKYTYRYP
jgi:chromosome segregation ATPase